jgi:hypothetical protein
MNSAQSTFTQSQIQSANRLLSSIVGRWSAVSALMSRTIERPLAEMLANTAVNLEKTTAAPPL